MGWQMRQAQPIYSTKAMTSSEHIHANILSTHARPKHTGTKVLFENPILERLTRTHIAVPVTVFMLYSAGLFAWSILETSLHPVQVSGLFLAGLLSFTLFEYVAHRFLYHMHGHSEDKDSVQYKLHGIHHEYPKDRTRLALPPWITVAVFTLILWGLHSVFGDGFLALFSGFLMGYALYLLVHYSVHAFAPPKNVFKVLWVNHALHHYKDEHSAFGVSSPLWDYVFGTLPQVQGNTERRKMAVSSSGGEPEA